LKKLFAARLMLDVAGRLIMMGVVIFLSRSLGVATFGQLAYGLSIVNISYFLCDFGVATFFLREMGRATDADRPVVWEKFFGLKVVMATVVLVLGSLLSFKLWRRRGRRRPRRGQRRGRRRRIPNWI
jgi:O-antigen/teichoic acid export membrane protein